MVVDHCVGGPRHGERPRHRGPEQHYRGEKQSPKGTIGTIGLTRALRAALVKHRKREPIGALVLYRRSHRTGGAWKLRQNIGGMLNLAGPSRPGSSSPRRSS